MLDSSADASALIERLEACRRRYPASDPEMVADIVRAVLSTMRGDLTAPETALLHEVAELGQVIANAKAEIEALRANDISTSHIPSATDELDAIVTHTAMATEAILETCETLDTMAETLDPAYAAKLQDATTRIYEACSFQDITGQRITKVVQTLKRIEEKVTQIITAFGVGEAMPAAAEEISLSSPISEEALLNGPQLPSSAMDQSDIDRLLASFD
jgi:chemotaxis protein CheZ